MHGLRWKDAVIAYLTCDCLVVTRVVFGRISCKMSISRQELSPIVERSCLMLLRKPGSQCTATSLLRWFSSMQARGNAWSLPNFGCNYEGFIDNCFDDNAILFSRCRTPAAFAGCIFNSIFVSACLTATVDLPVCSEIVYCDITDIGTAIFQTLSSSRVRDDIFKTKERDQASLFQWLIAFVNGMVIVSPWRVIQ